MVQGLGFRPLCGAVSLSLSHSMQARFWFRVSRFRFQVCFEMVMCQGSGVGHGFGQRFCLLHPLSCFQTG